MGIVGFGKRAQETGTPGSCRIQQPLTGSGLVFENRDSLDRLLRGVTTPQWSMPSRIYYPPNNPYNGCSAIDCAPGPSGDVACQIAGQSQGLSCSSCGGSFDSPLGGVCG